MNGAERFPTTKTVLPWRANVYEKAARKTRGGVSVNLLDTSGEEIIVQINGPNERHQRFVNKDTDLIRRVNHQKLTLNPLLLPFVWGTRKQQRVEERHLQEISRQRLG